MQRIEQPGGAIEALVGSDVELAVTTTAVVKRATLVFLESGKRVDLAADAPSDDSGQQLVQRARFVVEASDRTRSSCSARTACATRTRAPT